MLMDYEVYITHPCLLDRARNSQPWSSCQLPSVHQSLPFGLRNLRQINTALVFAKLAPQIHKTFSPVSGLGTRRCTADPGPAIPSAVALGQKGRTLFMGFPLYSPCGKSELTSLYPHHWVYLKEPKPPFRYLTVPNLNKFVEISTTTGRFCSWCRILFRSVCQTMFPKKSYAVVKGQISNGPDHLESHRDIKRPPGEVPFQAVLIILISQPESACILY